MALWVCDDCTTAYSVGAPACPHCNSTSHHEEGDMAKISKHAGATNAREDVDGQSDETDSGSPSPLPVDHPTPAPAPTPEALVVADPAEPEPAVDPPVRPSTNDPKADWIDYAVTLGIPPMDAEALTKRELIAAVDQLEDTGA